MLLLGVLAAQAEGAVAAAGSYDLLETEILTGTQATVTFSSLGSYSTDYQHLQLRIAARSNRASNVSDALDVVLNADTSTSYAHHLLYGNGSSVNASQSTSNSKILLDRLTATSAAANSFGALVIDILDPFETTKNTTIRNLGGTDSQPGIYLESGLYYKTDAITEIELAPTAGSAFEIGSRFSLYGLRSA